MNRLIKFIYCLSLNTDRYKKICAYTKYLDSGDMRTLKLVKKFYCDNETAAQDVLDYILNYKEYVIIAAKRWQKYEEAMRKVEY